MNPWLCVLALFPLSLLTACETRQADGSGMARVVAWLEACSGKRVDVGQGHK